MIRPAQPESSVARMWTDVPAAVFERAPSTTGLFEQQEIEAVGRLLAKRNRLEGIDLLLLGSATAFREIAALRKARDEFGQPLPIKKITAVDIAPQLLEKAIRRMKLMREFGLVEEFEAIQGSITEVKSQPADKMGVAILGLYDLDCFLEFGEEINGEPVGLEEYGGGMRQILGPKTQILPLIFENGGFVETEPVIEYDSSRIDGKFSDIRQQLRQYRQHHPETVAMRIYISPEDLVGNETPLFVSTWFDLDKLPTVFEGLGLSCKIHQVNARKGNVLEIKNGDQEDTNLGTCALAMNNVFGNLATGEMMTGFTNEIQAICLRS